MISDPKTGKQLIYDAFVRDGWLYMVSTFYHYKDKPYTIIVNGRQAECVGANEYEPVCYYRVEIDTVPTTVIINDAMYNFPRELDILNSETGGKGGIAIATLFKNDYPFIPDMLSWYRKHGVAKFYFYFNGPTLPAGLPEGPDVQYHLWDFQYWNPGSDYKNHETGWTHAAQTAFLTMTRLRHLPDHKWIGLIDIDEVIYPVNGCTLATALDNISTEYNCVRIPNHWAISENNQITYSLTSDGPHSRTKCFYRGSYTALCGIHGPKPADAGTVLHTTDIRMLHIVNQSHPDRKSMICEPTATLQLT